MGKQQTKRIVITGVSRGLGLAMAQGFIERKHTVVGCARSADDVARLRKQWPAPHRFDVVDVGQDEQVRHWAKTSMSDGGPPDLLLNNAAIIAQNAPLWQVSAEEFDRVLHVNVAGVANAIRHFAPAMIQRGQGVIVNFSSGWGRSTSPEVATYCATKWAIEGLSRALAQELPRGLACVPLNPGIIHTDMLQQCFGDGAVDYPAPDEWARRAVPFLLSLNEKHNGQPLTVPGEDA